MYTRESHIVGLSRIYGSGDIVFLRHRAAFGGFYWNHLLTISSRISMFATRIMSTATTETLFASIYIILYVRLFVVAIRRWPVGGVFISPICSHFVDLITVSTSFDVFLIWTMITLLLIKEHLFVKGVCYLSIFVCGLGKQYSIRQYDRKQQAFCKL